jgi:hypothetical protein
VAAAQTVTKWFFCSGTPMELAGSNWECSPTPQGEFSCRLVN